MYRWLVLGALCTSGCLPSPGPCDQNAALELVYTEDGLPAFAGQAVMQTSCGNGGFCHSDGIAAEDRFGAPAGLGFDVSLASTTRSADPVASERLRTHTVRALNMRGSILAQVQGEHMPPGGDAGERYRCQILPTTCGEAVGDLTYDRFADDGTASRLPTLLDEDPASRAEAEDILRNWLSCGTPVVERTSGRPETNVIGFTAEPCERSCVDVTWPAIYESIIVPRCATSACHGTASASHRLDLAAGGAAEVYGRLLDRAPLGTGCGEIPAAGDPTQAMEPGWHVPTLVAGDADGSLLVMKIEAGSAPDVCGAPMPGSGSPLSDQRRCVIREWVACGACPEADGGACAACLETARTTCNSDPTAALGCIESSMCVNRAEL
ncbi:MAG: hypothetical protein H6719_27065 [Sandaracinaceae bacterium]|nr:hypothetical protein [Sandaracinaceae bacterium]